jgi:hypothetical protein
MGPIPEVDLEDLMRCPKCQSTGNFATETKRCTVNSSEDSLKRRRICRDCGAQWTTTERIDKWDNDLRQWTGHAEPELPKVDPVVRTREPRQSRPAASRFHPITLEQVADTLLGIPPEVCQMLLEWWNNSRRSKHGTAAAWTEKAFTMSVDRVKKLPHWQQVVLTKAGIEHGWQALNPSYCKDLLAKPPRQGGFQPQSQGLAGALAILQGGGNRGSA